MNKFDITTKLEKFAPPQTQEPWDCSGWAICTQRKDVSRVMLCLTITDDVYEQAKSNNCEMIVSHHPLFFVPLKYSDIDMYCMHTNLDKAQGGTTDTLIERLNYKVSETEDEFVRIVKLDKEIPLSQLEKDLRKISPNLRYTNNSNIKTVKTIGFCAGSGSEFANSCSADVFVTGDLKFHFATETKRPIFDIGHFESEILILDKLEKMIDTETIRAKESSPFIY